MGDIADSHYDAIIDDMCDDDDDQPSGDLTCRYCGLDGLHWVKSARTGWRMATPNGQVHNCCSKRRAWLKHHSTPCNDLF